MFDETPTPPAELPDEVVDRLKDESPMVLRAVAAYATELADARTDEDRSRDGGEEKTAEMQVEDEIEEDEAEQDSDAVRIEDNDRPEGVPGKASITVKEINENRYYYWQWRDGDVVKSKYHGPVDSDS